LSKGLYEKRQKVVANIPNFWPLVFEAAPQEVDEYIQPSDAAVILSALKSISVSRFELENDPKGEPRSLSIRWEFSENEYFEDTVLEKKFWYRHGLQGYAGLVSEPVDIKWKKGKDLTDGLLSLVKKCWDEEQANPSKAKPKDESELTANQKALKEQVENVAMGGVSFFAWFGYIGQRISAEENKKALEKGKEEKQKREAGDKAEEAEVEEEEEDEEDLIQSLEIFPDGDDVAYALAEDVWPHAIQYFSKSHQCYSRSCRGSVLTKLFRGGSRAGGYERCGFRG
jgi:hypothetical protein